MTQQINIPSMTREEIEAYRKGIKTSGGVPTNDENPAKKQVNLFDVDDETAFHQLIEAHYTARKTFFLWGRSGFGKSATIHQLAKKLGAKLIERFGIGLDPLTTAMPVPENGVLRGTPCDWLHEICTSNEKIILFIDEINKYSSENTQNMLNEIILNRSFAGHKIKDSVLIVGAGNFVAESERASPLDISILYRVTNILFAPAPETIIKNMQTKLGKKLAKDLAVVSSGADVYKTEILSKLHVNIPRQLDHIAEIIEASKGTLSNRAVYLLCEGRIGEEAEVVARAILE